MANLVKVNPQEFGLQEQETKQLTKGLDIVLQERVSLEQEFEIVSKLELTEENIPKFRELRLKVVKNRTQGIMKWHKKAKDYFLQGGKFVDAIRRKEIAVNEQMEEFLMKGEKHFELLEIERLKNLQLEREKELSKYVDDAHERELSSMEEKVWKAYLNAEKQEYDARIEEEKRLEQERIEEEKKKKLQFEREKEIAPFWQYLKDDEPLDEEYLYDVADKAWEIIIIDLKKRKADYDAEQERIRKENERLKKEAEKKESEQKRLEAERKANEEKERKAREEKARKEREQYELKLKKEREERERIEAQEKAKREKLEAELKAKREAEQKRLAEIEAKKQTELQKGDEDKMHDLIIDLQDLQKKYSFKSNAYKKKYADVNVLLNKVINHIKK